MENSQTQEVQDTLAAHAAHVQKLFDNFNGSLCAARKLAEELPDPKKNIIFSITDEMQAKLRAGNYSNSDFQNMIDKIKTLR